MTDEFEGFAFGTPPPGFIEHIQRQQQERYMHLTDNTHAIKQLFDSLDEDQLRALDILLANCGEASTVMFFRGRVEMLQQMKFNLCPCGINHDKELEGFGNHEHPPTAPNASNEHQGRPVEDVDLPSETVDLQQDRQALMEEYGIEPNPDHGKASGPIAPSPFRCKGCNIGVASLADRMLRPPGIGGCTGCQQKSAWG